MMPFSNMFSSTNKGSSKNLFSSLKQSKASEERRKKSVKFSDVILPAGSQTSRSSGSKSILKSSSLSKNDFKSSKNSMSSSFIKFSSDSMNMKSSLMSNTFEEEQSCDNTVTNKILRDKYEKSLSNLKKIGQRYTDELFPPLKTSL